ncbi:MAG: IPT/TIG domain-containing protein [Cyanobacteria bacterium P01_G01_bin.19]
MPIYTIRPNSPFTIAKDGILYIGGESVDLTESEFEIHKHKLEGVQSNITPLNVESCFPKPHISSISPAVLALGVSRVIEIKGSYFLPDGSVTIAGLTVDQYEFIDSSNIRVTVTTSGAVGFYDLTVDNGDSLTVANAIELISTDFIVDLRSGGSTFPNSAIEIRSGMSWNRTAFGLGVSGGSSWGRWVRFRGENDAWVKNRSEANPPALNLIFQPSFGMVGYGSDETNPNSTSQWNQGEIMGFVSASSLSGFYGNNGNPGSVASFTDTYDYGNLNSIYRLEFNGFGEPGAIINLYRCNSDSDGWEASGLTQREFIAQNSSTSDWLAGDLLKTWTVPNNMTADAPEIMPFLVPQNLSLNFMGFYYL